MKTETRRQSFRRMKRQLKVKQAMKTETKGIQLPVTVYAVQERAEPRFIRDASDRYLIDCYTPEIAHAIATALNGYEMLLSALKRISNGNDMARMAEWANDAIREVNGI